MTADFRTWCITHEFVIFKTLSYCFGETKEFGVKALFARGPVSRLLKRGNEIILRKDYSVPRDFSWIENYKPSYVLYILRMKIELTTHNIQKGKI